MLKESERKQNLIMDIYLKHRISLRKFSDSSDSEEGEQVYLPKYN